jgi:hypothetical protein
LSKLDIEKGAGVVRNQGSAECWQLFMSLQLSEAFGGFDHARGGSAQGHG